MENKVKRNARLIRAYGHNEVGMADLPRKISGISVSRVMIGDDNACSRCFPHGYETINSHIANRQRCWKQQRKTQWK